MTAKLKPYKIRAWLIIDQITGKPAAGLCPYDSFADALGDKQSGESVAPVWMTVKYRQTGNRRARGGKRGK